MKVMSPIGTYWIIRHKDGGWLPELSRPVRGVTSRGDYPEDFIGKPDPRPSRKAEDMKIVKADLSEIVEEIV